MKKWICSLAVASLFLFNSCSSDNYAVNQVDLTRYMGMWYEIARLENSFEKGMDHTTATYRLMPNGKVEVVNRGLLEGKIKSVKGKAYAPDSANPARLKVSFFWWFYSDYLILDVDPDYQYALVGGGSKDYLWILARKPKLSTIVKRTLLEKAKLLGYEVNKLIWVKQTH